MTPKKLKKKPKPKHRPGAKPEDKSGRPPGRKLTTPKTRVSGGKTRHKKEDKSPKRKRTPKKRDRLKK